MGGGGEKRPREENGAAEGARPAKAGVQSLFWCREVRKYVQDTQ